MTYMCDVNMTSNQAENDAIIDVLCSPPSDRTKWRLGTQVCLYTEIMQIRLHKVPWNDRLSLWLILSPMFTEFVIWSTVALKCGLIFFSFFFFFFPPFFLEFDFCRFCVVTTANDLRLRRISIPDLIHYIIFLS